MKIGYIGLGFMGKPCALNLLKAGHSLHVWARRPETVREVLEKGARLCDSIADVAARVEVLFLNVTNFNDVESILFADSGVTAGGRKGLIVVDMSTISAIATRDMAKRLEPYGIELVDAPVSGGTTGAINGTLTVMAGAGQATFERIRPLLLHMGKTVIRAGDVGAGQAIKSCNQIMVTGNLMAVVEALHFARAVGLDPAVVREVVLGCSGGSRILDTHGARMIAGDYEPGFKTLLHKKDMDTVQGMIRELGLDAPVSELGLDALARAVNAGYGELDSSSLYELEKKE